MEPEKKCVGFLTYIYYKNIGRNIEIRIVLLSNISIGPKNDVFLKSINFFCSWRTVTFFFLTADAKLKMITAISTRESH